jgi:hypothetical protein
MNADFRKISGPLLSLVLIALFPAAVSAYVLQGPHVIQLMAEKLGQAQSLSVSQRVIFYNPANSSNPQPAMADQTATAPMRPAAVQLNESLKYLFSEAFRSDISSELNQRVYVFNKGQSITVIDGVISEAGESRFDVYKDLLLYRSRDSLSDRLSNLGIDISVSSLGRFEGRPALVVGAEFPDESVPQLWIDKETFHPLRIMVFDTQSAYSPRNSFLEIRYSGWQQIGKINYPMQIEFVQDGLTVRAIEVDEYQINPSFSKNAFDIASLKLKYRQPLQTPDQTAENEGLSEVQKTIEEFKKIFE